MCGHTKSVPLSVFHSCIQVASDQRFNPLTEMKRKGTPKHERIPFLRFSDLSGRTIFEYRTFRIEYVDSIYPRCLAGRRTLGVQRLRGQKYEIKMRRREYGRTFLRKGLAFCVERGFFGVTRTKKCMKKQKKRASIFFRFPMSVK